LAVEVNATTENIGARRLATLMERLLAEISFEAPDMAGVDFTVDGEYVRRTLGDLVKDHHPPRYGRQEPSCATWPCVACSASPCSSPPSPRAARRAIRGHRSCSCPRRPPTSP